MDFLRRSIHNSREGHLPSISTPILSVSKPTPAIQPPKKVIRALDDYRPQAPNELGFTKGDFFHVVNEVDGWYEANNPMTGARGLVPRNKFEEFSKSNAAVHATQAARSMSVSLGTKQRSSHRQPVFYAIVQHDFVAERADELDAKAGDHISVVAQSNYEWFVAKPISRLGRPGLIPVSFVAIHDPSTGTCMSDEEVRALMERGEVPSVEEWKKSLMEYKSSSIQLGVIDDDSAARKSVSESSFVKLQSRNSQEIADSAPEAEQKTIPKAVLASLSPGILLSAEVLSWHFEMNEYWFRIHAMFQPDPPSGSSSLPPAKQLILFRVYNDFYNFQVDLLNTFPVEAGRESKGPNHEPRRILPYMPGPSHHIDDRITQLRKEELDQYLSRLCSLWENNAEHILRHQLILDFLTPKPGDAEEDVEPATAILEDRQSVTLNAIGQEIDQVRLPVSNLDVQGSIDRSGDSSLYEENGRVGRFDGIGGDGAIYRTNGVSSNFSRYSESRSREFISQDTRYSRSQSAQTSSSWTGSPQQHQRSISTSSTRYNPSETGAMRSMSSRKDHEQVMGYDLQHRSEVGTLHTSSSSSNRSQVSAASVASGQGRSRSTSTANSPTMTAYSLPSSTNSPSISVNNPNTAFIKIKIFDRLTQDLIAIRVSPRVTHTQLMDKVRSRLGPDVYKLAYRNSVVDEFMHLANDETLREWLESTDKHVLYAD